MNEIDQWERDQERNRKNAQMMIVLKFVDQDGNESRAVMTGAIEWDEDGHRVTSESILDGWHVPTGEYATPVDFETHKVTVDGVRAMDAAYVAEMDQLGAQVYDTTKAALDAAEEDEDENS
jgi:hypothetical protein